MNGYKNDYHLERKFQEHENLREMLRSSAEKYADKTAFVTKIRDADREVHYIDTTYKELFDEMNWLGTGLLSLGFGGSRIALIGENSYKWILTYFAVACGVGITVPLDKLLQRDELVGMLQRSEATAIFCDKKHYKMVQEIVASGETKVTIVVGLDFIPKEGLSILDLLDAGQQLIKEGDRRYLDAPIDRDAMNFLLFTSGTTQSSKAVMLSHRNLMSVNYYMNCEELFFPDDVNMLLLPLHHIYGMGGVLIFLSQGIKNVFCDGLKYITINMKEYKVSVMMAVPLLLEKMYKKIDKAIDKQGMRSKVNTALKVCAASEKVGIYLRRRMFKSIIDQLGGHLRFITNGAAPLDPVVAKGFNDFGILVVNGYGLTETSPTIASESYRHLRPGTCGKLMPHVEARIDEPDESGIGELVVRGDNVMLGYYGDPEATAAVLEPDGWFHTGDLAYFDEDGYIWITGRKKNVIVLKSGKNVFPEEIENLVNNLPYLEESMVFGRMRGGEFTLWVKAVVDKEYMKEENVTMADLEARFEKDLAAINASMPSYKTINHWFLSERPTIKTTTQKTKRNMEMIEIDNELEERGLV